MKSSFSKTFNAYYGKKDKPKSNWGGIKPDVFGKAIGLGIRHRHPDQDMKILGKMIQQIVKEEAKDPTGKGTEVFTFKDETKQEAFREFLSNIGQGVPDEDPSKRAQTPPPMYYPQQQQYPQPPVYPQPPQYPHATGKQPQVNAKPPATLNAATKAVKKANVNVGKKRAAAKNGKAKVDKIEAAVVRNQAKVDNANVNLAGANQAKVEATEQHEAVVTVQEEQAAVAAAKEEVERIAQTETTDGGTTEQPSAELTAATERLEQAEVELAAAIVVATNQGVDVEAFSSEEATAAEIEATTAKIGAAENAVQQAVAEIQSFEEAGRTHTDALKVAEEEVGDIELAVWNAENVHQAKLLTLQHEQKIHQEGANLTETQIEDARDALTRQLELNKAWHELGKEKITLATEHRAYNAKHSRLIKQIDELQEASNLLSATQGVLTEQSQLLEAEKGKLEKTNDKLVAENQDLLPEIGTNVAYKSARDEYQRELKIYIENRVIEQQVEVEAQLQKLIGEAEAVAAAISESQVLLNEDDDAGVIDQGRIDSLSARLVKIKDGMETCKSLGNQETQAADIRDTLGAGEKTEGDPQKQAAALEKMSKYTMVQTQMIETEKHLSAAEDKQNTLEGLLQTATTTQDKYEAIVEQDKANLAAANKKGTSALNETAKLGERTKHELQGTTGAKKQISLEGLGTRKAAVCQKLQTLGIDQQTGNVAQYLKTISENTTAANETEAQVAKIIDGFNEEVEPGSIAGSRQKLDEYKKAVGEYRQTIEDQRTGFSGTRDLDPKNEAKKTSDAEVLSKKIAAFSNTNTYTDWTQQSKRRGLLGQKRVETQSVVGQAVIDLAGSINTKISNIEAKIRDVTSATVEYEGNLTEYLKALEELEKLVGLEEAGAADRVKNLADLNDELKALLNDFPKTGADPEFTDSSLTATDGWVGDTAFTFGNKGEWTTAKDALNTSNTTNSAENTRLTTAKTDLDRKIAELKQAITDATGTDPSATALSALKAKIDELKEQKEALGGAISTFDTAVGALKTKSGQGVATNATLTTQSREVQKRHTAWTDAKTHLDTVKASIAEQNAAQPTGTQTEHSQILSEIKKDFAATEARLKAFTEGKTSFDELLDIQKGLAKKTTTYKNQKEADLGAITAKVDSGEIEEPKAAKLTARVKALYMYRHQAEETMSSDLNNEVIGDIDQKKAAMMQALTQKVKILKEAIRTNALETPSSSGAKTLEEQQAIYEQNMTDCETQGGKIIKKEQVNDCPVIAAPTEPPIGVDPSLATKTRALKTVITTQDPATAITGVEQLPALKVRVVFNALNNLSIADTEALAEVDAQYTPDTMVNGRSLGEIINTYSQTVYGFPLDITQEPETDALSYLQTGDLPESADNQLKLLIDINGIPRRMIKLRVQEMKSAKDLVSKKLKAKKAAKQINPAQRQYVQISADGTFATMDAYDARGKRKSDFNWDLESGSVPLLMHKEAVKQFNGTVTNQTIKALVTAAKGEPLPGNIDELLTAANKVNEGAKDTTDKEKEALAINKSLIAAATMTIDHKQKENYKVTKQAPQPDAVTVSRGKTAANCGVCTAQTTWASSLDKPDTVEKETGEIKKARIEKPGFSKDIGTVITGLTEYSTAIYALNENSSIPAIMSMVTEHVTYLMEEGETIPADSAKKLADIYTVALLKHSLVAQTSSVGAIQEHQLTLYMLSSLSSTDPGASRTILNALKYAGTGDLSANAVSKLKARCKDADTQRKGGDHQVLDNSLKLALAVPALANPKAYRLNLKPNSVTGSIDVNLDTLVEDGKKQGQGITSSDIKQVKITVGGTQHSVRLVAENLKGQTTNHWLTGTDDVGMATLEAETKHTDYWIVKPFHEDHFGGAHADANAALAMSLSTNMTGDYAIMGKVLRDLGVSGPLLELGTLPNTIDSDRLFVEWFDKSGGSLEYGNPIDMGIVIDVLKKVSQQQRLHKKTANTELRDCMVEIYEGLKNKSSVPEQVKLLAVMRELGANVTNEEEALLGTEGLNKETKKDDATSNVLWAIGTIQKVLHDIPSGKVISKEAFCQLWEAQYRLKHHRSGLDNQSMVRALAAEAEIVCQNRETALVDSFNTAETKTELQNHITGNLKFTGVEVNALADVGAGRFVSADAGGQNCVTVFGDIWIDGVKPNKLPDEVINSDAYYEKWGTTPIPYKSLGQAETKKGYEWKGNKDIEIWLDDSSGTADVKVIRRIDGVTGTSELMISEDDKLKDIPGLLKENCECWIDSTGVIYAYDKDTKEQVWTKDAAGTITRSKGKQQLMTGPIEKPLQTTLDGFSDGKEILCWGKDGTYTSIEMPEIGLTFGVKDGKTLTYNEMEVKPTHIAELSGTYLVMGADPNAVLLLPRTDPSTETYVIDLEDGTPKPKTRAQRLKLSMAYIQSENHDLALKTLLTDWESTPFSEEEVSIIETQLDKMTAPTTHSKHWKAYLASIVLENLSSEDPQQRKLLTHCDAAKYAGYLCEDLEKEIPSRVMPFKDALQQARYKEKIATGCQILMTRKSEMENKGAVTDTDLETQIAKYTLKAKQTSEGVPKRKPGQEMALKHRANELSKTLEQSLLQGDETSIPDGELKTRLTTHKQEISKEARECESRIKLILTEKQKSFQTAFGTATMTPKEVAVAVLQPQKLESAGLEPEEISELHELSVRWLMVKTRLNQIDNATKEDPIDRTLLKQKRAYNLRDIFDSQNAVVQGTQKVDRLSFVTSLLVLEENSGYLIRGKDDPKDQITVLENIFLKEGSRISKLGVGRGKTSVYAALASMLSRKGTGKMSWLIAPPQLIQMNANELSLAFGPAFVHTGFNFSFDYSQKDNPGYLDSQFKKLEAVQETGGYLISGPVTEKTIITSYQEMCGKYATEKNPTKKETYKKCIDSLNKMLTLLKTETTQFKDEIHAVDDPDKTELIVATETKKMESEQMSYSHELLHMMLDGNGGITATELGPVITDKGKHAEHESLKATQIVSKHLGDRSEKDQALVVAFLLQRDENGTAISDVTGLSDQVAKIMDTIDPDLAGKLACFKHAFGVIREGCSGKNKPGVNYGFRKNLDRERTSEEPVMHIVPYKEKGVPDTSQYDDAIQACVWTLIAFDTQGFTDTAQFEYILDKLVKNTEELDNIGGTPRNRNFIGRLVDEYKQILKDVTSDKQQARRELKNNSKYSSIDALNESLGDNKRATAQVLTMDLKLTTEQFSADYTQFTSKDRIGYSGTTEHIKASLDPNEFAADSVDNDEQLDFKQDQGYYKAKNMQKVIEAADNDPNKNLAILKTQLEETGEVKTRVIADAAGLVVNFDNEDVAKELVTAQGIEAIGFYDPQTETKKFMTTDKVVHPYLVTENGALKLNPVLQKIIDESGKSSIAVFADQSRCTGLDFKDVQEEGTNCLVTVNPFTTDILKTQSSGRHRYEHGLITMATPKTIESANTYQSKVHPNELVFRDDTGDKTNWISQEDAKGIWKALQEEGVINENGEIQLDKGELAERIGKLEFTETKSAHVVKILTENLEESEISGKLMHRMHRFNADEAYDDALIEATERLLTGYIKDMANTALLELTKDSESMEGNRNIIEKLVKILKEKTSTGSLFERYGSVEKSQTKQEYMDAIKEKYTAKVAEINNICDLGKAHITGRKIESTITHMSANIKQTVFKTSAQSTNKTVQKQAAQQKETQKETQKERQKTTETRKEKTTETRANLPQKEFDQTTQHVQPNDNPMPTEVLDALFKGQEAFKPYAFSQSSTKGFDVPIKTTSGTAKSQALFIDQRGDGDYVKVRHIHDIAKGADVTLRDTQGGIKVLTEPMEISTALMEGVQNENGLSEFFPEVRYVLRSKDGQKLLWIPPGWAQSILEKGSPKDYILYDLQSENPKLTTGFTAKTNKAWIQLNIMAGSPLVTKMVTCMAESAKKGNKAGTGKLKKAEKATMEKDFKREFHGKTDLDLKAECKKRLIPGDFKAFIENHPPPKGGSISKVGNDRKIQTGQKAGGVYCALCTAGVLDDKGKIIMTPSKFKDLYMGTQPKDIIVKNRGGRTEKPLRPEEIGEIHTILTIHHDDKEISIDRAMDVNAEFSQPPIDTTEFFEHIYGLLQQSNSAKNSVATALYKLPLVEQCIKPPINYTGDKTYGVRIFKNQNEATITIFDGQTKVKSYAKENSNEKDKDGRSIIKDPLTGLTFYIDDQAFNGVSAFTSKTDRSVEFKSDVLGIIETCQDDALNRRGQKGEDNKFFQGLQLLQAAM